MGCGGVRGAVQGASELPVGEGGRSRAVWGGLGEPEVIHTSAVPSLTHSRVHS